MAFCLAIASTVVLAACACAQAPPAVPAPAVPAPSGDVDALLASVERVAATLRDFRAAVTVETTDDITGDTERRLGKVILSQDEGVPTSRRFAVILEKFIDGTGRMDERPVRYLYADGWLTEADFRERTLIRRQLARPGEPYDPLKPGEGPVPLPIGQRAGDVRARFEPSVSGAAPPAALASAGASVTGLRLVPRPGMADRDLVEATVWYDAATFVPRAVDAKRRNGRTLVLLRDPVVNAGLDDGQRALLSLAAGETTGWRVDERPLPPAAPERTP
jgi:outer membrane lipoprotein-sorting protein